MSPAEQAVLKQIQFLRYQMQYFVNSLDEYIMTEAITAAWAELKDKLPRIELFEELVHLHADYLDFILDKCFLFPRAGKSDSRQKETTGLKSPTPKSGATRLQTTLDQMFGFVLKLNFLVKEHGRDLLTSFEAKSELRTVERSFGDYARFLYQVVKQLSSRG